MNSQELSSFDLLIESHLDLERQGPGSSEMTLKALNFIDGLDADSHVADIGCGTGSQTITLAENCEALFTGVDMVPDFIEVFNTRVKDAGLEGRVSGVTGDALDLPFAKQELDLMWSEGMIDSTGFEKTLTYWNDFIKDGGYIAVTSPSWFSEKRPQEIEEFWVDAGSGLSSVESNIEALQRAGYSFIAAFSLPESCWIDNYYNPRTASEQKLRETYPDNALVEDYIMSMQHEVDLYAKHKDAYGYVFYIGRKPANLR